MAKRNLSGAVNFQYLEDYTAGDAQVIDEVLSLFREQARVWLPLLDPAVEGWQDAVHTIKGTARAVGAFDLGDVCQVCENEGPPTVWSRCATPLMRPYKMWRPMPMSGP